MIAKIISGIAIVVCVFFIGGLSLHGLQASGAVASFSIILAGALIAFAVGDSRK